MKKSNPRTMKITINQTGLKEGERSKNSNKLKMVDLSLILHLEDAGQKHTIKIKGLLKNICK